MSDFSSSVDAFFNTAGKYDTLEHDQVCALATTVQAWQQHANGPDAAPYLIRVRGLAARDKLVRHNLKLIIHTWKNSYSVRITKRSSSLLDAFQCAAIGLTRAAEKYEPSKAKFSTYAVVWIHKGFRDFLCDDRLVRISRKNVHLIHAANRMVLDAKAQGKPEPSAEELVERISKSRKNIPSADGLRELLKANYITNPVSMSQPLDGQDRFEGQGFGETIADTSAVQDDDMATVRDCIKYLDDQERAIIEAVYFSERTPTLADIGKQLGVSKSRVGQIKDRALASIRNLAAVD